MPHLRAAGLLALTLFGLPFVSANAAPNGTLRVTGRFTGYADLTLTRPTVFDGRGATLDVRGGSYVAWWITKIGEQPTPQSNQAGGLRWVAHDPTRSRRSTHFGERAEPLVPGRYRLYLATDGYANVVVPATGLDGDLNVTPRFRTTSSGGTRAFTVFTGVVNSESRYPVVLARSALVASSVLVLASPGIAVQSLTACATPRGAECGGPTSSSGYTSSLFDDHGVQLTTRYHPGSAPTGPADAVQRAKAGPGVYAAYGSYFSLTAVL